MIRFIKPKINVCLVLLCLLFTSVHTYAQELEYLEGVVLSQGQAIQDVHIKNTSNNQYVITNEKGFFKINARVGDSLAMTHISMLDLLFVIRESDFTRMPLIIEMGSRELALDEVVITNPLNLSAESLGIVKKAARIPTVNERRLHTAGDFKAIQLLNLIGGSGLPLHAVINKISGKTKRIKAHIALDKKEANRLFLETYYYDYLLGELKVTEQEVGRFLYYLVDDEMLQNVINQQHEEKLRIFILDRWLAFKNRANQE